VYIIHITLTEDNSNMARVDCCVPLKQLYFILVCVILWNTIHVCYITCHIFFFCPLKFVNSNIITKRKKFNKKSYELKNLNNLNWIYKLYCVPEKKCAIYLQNINELTRVNRATISRAGSEKLFGPVWTIGR